MLLFIDYSCFIHILFMSIIIEQAAVLWQFVKCHAMKVGLFVIFLLRVR